MAGLVVFDGVDAAPSAPRFVVAAVSPVVGLLLLESMGLCLGSESEYGQIRTAITAAMIRPDRSK